MPTLQQPSQSPTFPLTVRRKMVGFKERLAERIIEAREAQGWDQRELAYRAGVADRTVARLEQAKVDRPRPSTLRKIADATGRKVEELRPDMDTEEKNLRAQLDRIEEKLDEILERLRRLAPDEDEPTPTDLPGEQETPPEDSDAAEPGTG